MEPSVKDKHIILGFVGFAILLISSIATLIVAEKFNQDTFVRMIVFVCSNLLGWLLYFSFQTVIFRYIRNLQNQVRQEKDTCRNHRNSGRPVPRCTQACNIGINANRWRSDPGYKTDRDCHIPGASPRRTVPITRTGSSGKMRSASLWSWNTSISSCPVLPTRRP